MFKILFASAVVWTAAFWLLKPPEVKKTLIFDNRVPIDRCQKLGGRVEYAGEVWQGYAGCWMPVEYE